MPNNLRIFIGYDTKEPAAYHTLVHSILSRATCPVSITPLVQSSLRAQGLYTRERGVTESTEFSITRFLVPYLSDYTGYSVFMDCDMLCRVDIDELYAELIPDTAVQVCQHDYTPKAAVKMQGQIQTAYPRKNWSSFMVFDNALCQALTPAYVNQASGLELHRFKWLQGHYTGRSEQDLIGALPLEWNWLVGEYGGPNVWHAVDAPKILHWTLGGPWFPEYQDADYAQEWIAERNAAFGQVLTTK